MYVIPSDSFPSKILIPQVRGEKGERGRKARATNSLSTRQPGRTPRPRFFAIEPVLTWRRDAPVTRLILMNDNLQRVSVPQSRLCYFSRLLYSYALQDYASLGVPTLSYI